MDFTMRALSTVVINLLTHARRLIAVAKCARAVCTVRLLLLAILLAQPVSAADVLLVDDGAPFDVRSAFIEPREHVYQLNATLDLSLSSSAVRALADGVPVTIELDLTIVRNRRYLTDVQIGSLVQRWQLRYDALSERYLVKNLNSSQQTSHATLQAAIAELSVIQSLPILDESLMQKGKQYEASLRVMTTVDGGLPTALKYVMFWIDWRRISDWYTWTVRP
jgi:hypothetical protein